MTALSAQDKQKEIAFFDGHAAADAYDVFTPESNARLITTCMRLARAGRGARVADLGCGSGVFTDLLHKQGYDAVGLDISPKLIARSIWCCLISLATSTVVSSPQVASR